MCAVARSAGRAFACELRKIEVGHARLDALPSLDPSAGRKNKKQQRKACELLEIKEGAEDVRSNRTWGSRLSTTTTTTGYSYGSLSLKVRSSPPRRRAARGFGSLSLKVRSSPPRRPAARGFRTQARAKEAERRRRPPPRLPHYVAYPFRGSSAVERYTTAV